MDSSPNVILTWYLIHGFQQCGGKVVEVFSSNTRRHEGSTAQQRAGGEVKFCRHPKRVSLQPATAVTKATKIPFLRHKRNPQAAAL